MGYYGSAFKAIANDNFGEAARPRLHLRAANGSNLARRSDALDDAAWDKSSANIATIATGTGNPYGSPWLLLLAGTPGDWENIAQIIGRVDDSRLMVWGLFSEYAPLPGRTYLLFREESGGGTASMWFEWSGGVPAIGASSLVGSSERGGVFEVDGSGWWVVWYSVAISDIGGGPGDDYRVRVYPSGGSSFADVGRGVYCAHLQVQSGGLELETFDAQWSPVRTKAAPIETGAPGELITVNDIEEVVRANPVRVKREEDFGFVHAQQWQAMFTNEALTLGTAELSGGWAALEMGFSEADEWALVAQGRIARARASSELTVSIDVDSPLQQLLDGETVRGVRFDPSSGWSSSIETIEKADTSSDYDNDASGAGVTITSAPAVTSQRVTIEFMTATAFKAIAEDGTEHDNGGAGYSIASDAAIGSLGIRVEFEGWDQTASAYAADDRFFFDLSRYRNSAGALAPVAVIKELLTSTEFLDLRVFNVIDGWYYSTPLYDKAGTWDTADATSYSSTELRGTWEEGTRIIDMVEGVLRVINASIYTMPNGQLALFETLPNERPALVFNGDPERGRVNVLSMTVFDDEQRVSNVVRYKYRTINTNVEATGQVRDPNSPVPVDQITTVDMLNWQCDSASVNAAANKLLNRLKRNQRRYELRTTLAGAVVDMDDPVAINDPMIGVSDTTLVREIAVDLIANEAALYAQIDPVILNQYARIGISTINGADLIF